MRNIKKRKDMDKKEKNIEYIMKDNEGLWIQ